MTRNTYVPYVEMLNQNQQNDQLILRYVTFMNVYILLEGQFIDNRKKSSKNVPNQHNDHYIIAANHVLCKLLIT
jgi:hypothetical protein